MILTAEARRTLQFMNTKGQLLASEILRESRKTGSPLAHYFTPGCSRPDVADKLISLYMRTRFND